MRPIAINRTVPAMHPRAIEVPVPIVGAFSAPGFSTVSAPDGAGSVVSG
jgi:hypothetical protein